MIRMIIGAVLLVASASAIAQNTGTTVHSGNYIFDTNHVRIGTIDRVLKDGSVRVIVGTRFVTIPGATITVADNDVKTSLTRKEVSHIE